MTEFTEGPTVTVNEAALRQVLKDYRTFVCHATKRDEPLSLAYYALKIAMEFPDAHVALLQPGSNTCVCGEPFGAAVHIVKDEP